LFIVKWDDPFIPFVLNSLENNTDRRTYTTSGRSLEGMLDGSNWSISDLNVSLFIIFMNDFWYGSRPGMPREGRQSMADFYSLSYPSLRSSSTVELTNSIRGDYVLVRFLMDYSSFVKTAHLEVTRFNDSLSVSLFSLFSFSWIKVSMFLVSSTNTVSIYKSVTFS
jgi:hypothetical protein